MEGSFSWVLRDMPGKAFGVVRDGQPPADEEGTVLAIRKDGEELWFANREGKRGIWIPMNQFALDPKLILSGTQLVEVAVANRAEEAAERAEVAAERAEAAAAACDEYDLEEEQEATAQEKPPMPFKRRPN